MSKDYKGDKLSTPNESMILHILSIPLQASLTMILAGLITSLVSLFLISIYWAINGIPDKLTRISPNDSSNEMIILMVIFAVFIITLTVIAYNKIVNYWKNQNIITRRITLVLSIIISLWFWLYLASYS